MKNSIVWLASYPKSGNTWTRVFLANYLMNTREPLPINQVHRFASGDSIAKMYHMVAGRQIDINDIDLTLHLRDKVLRGIIANNADINLVKTHNARLEARGVTLIPSQYTRSAIYVIRNPLDMVLSYARHYGISHAEAVEQVTHPDNANAPADDDTTVQFLGSWSEHVRSWISKAPYPTLVMRYEDLLTDPHRHFSTALRHLGMPVNNDRLDRAIRFSSFDELSGQEEKAGFVEASDKGARFFGKGRMDQWKTDLAPKLVKKLTRSERKVMRKFGYLE